MSKTTIWTCDLCGTRFPAEAFVPISIQPLNTIFVLDRRCDQTNADDICRYCLIEEIEKLPKRPKPGTAGE